MRMSPELHEDATKTTRMLVAIDKFKQNKGVGTFDHCPGFGKTREGLMILENCINSRNYSLSPYTNFLIVTPSAIIAQMWEEQIKDNFPTIQHKIFVKTIDSITFEFIEELKFYLVIYDEIHKYLSDIYFEKMTNIEHVFRLGLSGSIPDIFNKYFNRLHSFCPVIDTISEKEAITNNWTSKYIEYNIGLKLSDEDRVAYLKYSTKITEILDKYKRDYQKFSIGSEYVFDGDLNLILSGLSGKKIGNTFVKSNVIRNQIAKIHNWHIDINPYIPEEKLINDMYHPDIIFHDSKVLQNMVHLRSDILNNNIIKINACAEIYKLNLGKTIIFNESTDMADKLGLIIPKSLVFHTYIKAQPIIDITTGEYYKKKTKDEVKLFGKTSLKALIPTLLTTDALDCIITARALDEGFNAPCISTVITTAGSMNYNQHKQRSARAKRIDFDNPDKRVIIINFFFDDFTLPDGTNVNSRDKEKLIARQKFMNVRPIWCKSIQEYEALEKEAVK